MYNSLEVRAPFMDQKLVEFLLTLPQSFKQKGNEGKYILKKLMENKLPQDIIYRPKKGFGIPLSDWIRKDLRNSIEDTLLSPQPFFNRDYIQKILNEHLQRKQNHRKLIWNLYMFLRFSHHFPSLEL
jgi:asparagine synthase (glutamine-hydrolysing)